MWWKSLDQECQQIKQKLNHFKIFERREALLKHAMHFYNWKLFYN